MESTSLYIRIFALHWGLSGGLTFLYFRAIVKLIHKSHWLAISICMALHNEATAIWPPFGWWHFQSHFLAWELLYLIPISPNYSQAGCPNNNKLLSKPMMVHLTDGHVCHFPDNKYHGANMGSIWVLSAPDGSHVGPMNLAIRVAAVGCQPDEPLASLVTTKSIINVYGSKGRLFRFMYRTSVSQDYRTTPEQFQNNWNILIIILWSVSTRQAPGV